MFVFLSSLACVPVFVGLWLGSFWGSVPSSKQHLRKPRCLGVHMLHFGIHTQLVSVIIQMGFPFSERGRNSAESP